MKETPTVTIRTAMDTEDVDLILQKIEDDLCDIVYQRDLDEQTRTTRLETLLDWVQDRRFDIEKGV